MRRFCMTTLLLGALISTFACLASDRPNSRAGAAPADNSTPPATATAASEKTAAADSELVTSGPADQADITIYGNSFAQVQESRTVRLKAGRNRVQLNGVAAKYRTDSLRLIDAKGPGAFAYRSATYQPANLTNERLLAESIGKQVKAWRSTVDGKKEVNGTLQSVNGSGLVISLSDGKTELVNTGEVTLLETPTGLSNTPALVVEADVTTGGDYNLTFLYETEGVTWNAKHSLIFDEEKSVVLSWETTISLVNDSGTSYNANVSVMSDKNLSGGAPGGLYAASNMRSADMASPEAATVENVGDQKVYSIPGTVKLAAGQTRQIPLFSGKDVPVKRQYVVGTVVGRNYGGDGKNDAQVRLTIENCEKHHLGKPIPSGLVKVYQYNAAKKLQLTGSTRLGEKAQDEIFDLNIGTSSDIKWELKMAEAKPVAGADADDAAADAPAAPRPARRAGAQQVAPTQPQGEQPQFEDRTFEVTVYNYKRDKSVEVKVEVNVPAKQQLEPKWARPRADRAETTLTVPQTGKTSIRYTIRTQVR